MYTTLYTQLATPINRDGNIHHSEINCTKSIILFPSLAICLCACIHIYIYVSMYTHTYVPGRTLQQLSSPSLPFDPSLSSSSTWTCKPLRLQSHSSCWYRPLCAYVRARAHTPHASRYPNQIPDPMMPSTAL